MFLCCDELLRAIVPFSEFVLCIAVDLSKHEIRADENLEDFCACDVTEEPRVVPMPDGEPAVTFADVRTQVGFLTLFEERGLFSGMCYQAPVNHRSVKVADIVCQRRVNDEVYGPFMESLVSGEPHLQFDKNNVISLWFHGVETGDDSGCRLKSHNLVHASKDEGGVIAGAGFGFSFIRGKHAIALNGNIFKRCLRFFNYKWVDKQGVEKEESCLPTLDDLNAFCRLFAECDFKTENGFKSFLTKFSLSGLYEFQEGVCLHEQYRMFGCLLTSLVPMRVAVYDGQHRFMPMGLSMCGFYTPDNKMPLTKGVSFAEKHGVNHETAWENLQCWRTMNMKIGCVAAETLVASFAALAKVGVIETMSQSVNFGLSWKSLLTKVAMVFEEKYESNRIKEVVGFTDFWSNDAPASDVIEHNQTKMWEAVMEVAEMDEAYKKYLMRGVEFTEERWRMMVDSAAAKMVKANYLPAKPGRQVVGIGRDLMYVLQSLKAVCHDRKDVLRLVAMFDQQHPQHLQYEGLSLDTEKFHGMEWFKKFVHYPLFNVYTHFMQKVMVERKVMEVLRGETILGSMDSKGESISDMARKVLKKGGNEFPFLMSAKLVNVRTLKEVTYTSIGIRGNVTMDKIKVGAFSAMFRSICDAIMIYGYDPNLGFDKNGSLAMNGKLMEYLT